MKLYGSTLSPFVRKVLVSAEARGVSAQIEFIPVVAFDSPADLVGVNPLSKVPALLADDGTPFFDSPVICEYLDSLGTAPPLFPPAGTQRFDALRTQAAADGLMEAAVSRRMSSLAPRDDARVAHEARQAAVVARTLDWLETRELGPLDDIGSVAACCALAYLDFRFAHEDWRTGRPRLVQWQAGLAALPAYALAAVSI